MNILENIIFLFFRGPAMTSFLNEMKLLTCCQSTLSSQSYFRPKAHVRQLVKNDFSRRLAIVSIDDSITLFQEEKNLFYSIGFIHFPFPIDSISFSPQGDFLMVQSFDAQFDSTVFSQVYEIIPRNIKLLKDSFNIYGGCWFIDSQKMLKMIASLAVLYDDVVEFSLCLLQLSSDSISIEQNLIATRFSHLINPQLVIDCKAFSFRPNYISVYLSCLCASHRICHKLQHVTFYRDNETKPYYIVGHAKRYFNAPILTVMSNDSVLFVIALSFPQNQPRMMEHCLSPEMSPYHRQMKITGSVIFSEHKHIFIINPQSFTIFTTIGFRCTSQYMFHLRYQPMLYFVKNMNDIVITNELLLLNVYNVDHSFPSYDKNLLIRIHAIRDKTLVSAYCFPILNHKFSFMNNIFLFSTGYTIHTYGISSLPFGALVDAVLKKV